MYLGEKEIIKTMEDGEITEITLENDEIVRMNTDLFDLIKTDKKINQPYQYLINSVMATKFLEQMAEYGLEYKYASNVGQSMSNLAFNLRDEKVAKKFDVQHPDEIKLNDIISK